MKIKYSLYGQMLIEMLVQNLTEMTLRQNTVRCNSADDAMTERTGHHIIGLGKTAMRDCDTKTIEDLL